MNESFDTDTLRLLDETKEVRIETLPTTIKLSPA